MHRHTGPAPGIMVWGGICYLSRTPIVRITASTTSPRCWSQLSFLIFRAWSQPYFNRIMRDHTWHALSKGSCQSPDGIAFLVGSLSGSFADRSHGCLMIDPDYTPSCPTRSLWQRVEAAWSAAPQEHIQSLFESMPRRVAMVISNNGGYTVY
ncbi:UNVERIFIED_CONTAM: hypothetical protein NCL1_04034 [Trichonephila clavipes]